MLLGCPPFLSLSWKSDRTFPTLREQGRPGRPWGNRGENPYIHLKIIGAPGIMLSSLSMLHLQSGWMFRNLRALYTPKKKINSVCIFVIVLFPFMILMRSGSFFWLFLLRWLLSLMAVIFLAYLCSFIHFTHRIIVKGICIIGYIVNNS